MNKFHLSCALATLSLLQAERYSYSAASLHLGAYLPFWDLEPWPVWVALDNLESHLCLLKPAEVCLRYCNSCQAATYSQRHKHPVFLAAVAAGVNVFVIPCLLEQRIPSVLFVYLAVLLFVWQCDSSAASGQRGQMLLCFLNVDEEEVSAQVEKAGPAVCT